MIPAIPVIGALVAPLVSLQQKRRRRSRRILHMGYNRLDKLDMVRDKPYHRNATEP